VEGLEVVPAVVAHLENMDVGALMVEMEAMEPEAK
jgi:hypothetical protein